MNTTSSRMTIDVQSLRKTYPGGVEAVKGDRFRRWRRRGVRAAWPERRGQIDDDRDAHDDDRADDGTARLAGFDVARDPIAARGVASVVFQEAVVDSGLTGRANLELHARLWGVGVGQADNRIAELVQALRARGADRPRGRQLQRRPAPPTRDRACARITTAGAVPGRADGRPRRPHPPRAARSDQEPSRPV